MRRALGECAITGVSTTIPFHQQILQHEAFIRGEIYTDFIQQHMDL
jgi:acetyl-CoA carboxylase biotin carboxylase subunit